MGNCVSVHKNTDPSLKFSVQIESSAKAAPIKSKLPDGELGFRPQSFPVGQLAGFRDFGSKEELFFDSQPWLDSDSEDFFSVNGDLTPSRGSTPIHHSSGIGTPHLDKNLDNASISVPEPSPTDVKKQLIELFHESFSRDHVHGNEIPQSATKSPFESVENSVCSTETTPYRGRNSRKEKLVQSPRCCLPNLARSLSFGERKRRLSSASSIEG